MYNRCMSASSPIKLVILLWHRSGALFVEAHLSFILSFPSRNLVEFNTMMIASPCNVLLLLVFLAATTTTPPPTTRQKQGSGFVLAETRPSISKANPPRFWPVFPQFKLLSTVYFDASRFATDDNAAVGDDRSKACDANAATSPEHDEIMSDASPTCSSLSSSSSQEPVQTARAHEENTPRTGVVAGTEASQQHPSPQQQEHHEADENNEDSGHSTAAVLSAATATTSTSGSFEKTNIAWKRAKVAFERVRHVRREVKAIFSSELECCLLKVSCCVVPSTWCEYLAVCFHRDGVKGEAAVQTV